MLGKKENNNIRRKQESKNVCSCSRDIEGNTTRHFCLAKEFVFFLGGGGRMESQSCCHACCCGLSDFERNRITPRFVGGSAHETRLLALHQKNSSRCFCLKLHLPRTRCGLRLFPSSVYSSRSFFFFRRYSCLVFTAASLFLVKLSRRFLSQFATEATRIRLVFLCVPFFFVGECMALFNALNKPPLCF